MKKFLLLVMALAVAGMAMAQPTSVPAPTGDDIINIYTQNGNATGYGWANWWPTDGNGNGCEWGVEETIGNGKAFKIPNLIFYGSQFEFIDAGNKKYLHLDVYPMEDMTLGIVPICTSGGHGTSNLLEKGARFDLTGGQWNALDIELQSIIDRGYDFSYLYQIKYVSDIVAFGQGEGQADGMANGDGTKSFYVGNVYLTGTRIADTEAPVLVSAEVANVLGNEVTLTLNATDNNGKVSFVITDEANSKEYSTNGNSGENVTYNVKGLNAETEYTWTVQAKDQAGNLSENTLTVTFTTLEGFKLTTAPTPQHSTEDYDITSIFSDAYDKAAPNAFFNTWGSAGEILSIETIDGDNIQKVANFGYLGNEFTDEFDLQGYTLHMDLCPTELTQIGLTPITMNVKASAPRANRAELSTLFNVTPGQWNSLNLNLEETWPTLDMSQVFQFKWDRGNSQSDLYIDNVYFYKEKVSTGLSEVVAAQSSNVWYDLMGRRYTSQPTTAGIYINNGRKVVIK